MEHGNPTVPNLFCRQSIATGLQVAIVQTSDRERRASPNYVEVSQSETHRLIEEVITRIYNAPDVTEGLCEHCKTIDIVSHLSRRERSETRLELRLGTLLEILAGVHCEFCSFLGKIIRDQYAGIIDDAFWSYCCIGGKMVECTLEQLFVVPRILAGPTNPPRRIAFVVKLEPHLFLSPRHYRHELARTALTPTFNAAIDPTSATENLYRVRQIPSQIDLGLARRWLNMCEKLHPYIPYRIPQLRVIDLAKKCLIIPNTPVRYVTLSYTWGGNAQKLKLWNSNSEVLHTPGNLAKDIDALSRTIRDSMTVTEKLGERFLWVDALCITQDEVAERQAQITIMDQIYQNSVLTLIAVAGADAEFGLPGVHPETRIPIQISGNIRGQRYQSHDVQKWWIEKEQSVWGTRGWTYQEDLCSNRRLIFGKSQMHFECSGRCSHCEEMESEVDLAGPTLLTVPSPQLTNFFPRSIWSGLTDSFGAYINVISQYSKKSISDPNDEINAISGVLNRWRRHYGHRGVITGLPVGMLDAALLWYCKGEFQRRKDPNTGRLLNFPTWSWAAWEGEVDFRHSTLPYDTIKSMITWEVEEREEGGEVFRWRNYLPWEDPRLCDGPSSNWKRIVNITPINDALGIHYIDTALPAGQANFAYPSRRNSEAAIVASTNARYGTLRFRAKCATFALTNEDILFPSGSLGPPRDAGTLSVLDEDGSVIGAVHVPPGWSEALASQRQQFTVLSRTTLTQQPDDPSWDNVSQSFLQQEPEDREQIRHDGAVTQHGLDIHFGRKEPTAYAPSWRLFDRTKYSAVKFWPLYNVLLVQYNRTGYAYRYGIGQIHVDAFDPVAEEKFVMLA